MEDEKVVTGEMEDDKASNSGSGSSASHSSEDFVKVNKDDASLEETAGDIPREDVEEVPIVGDPAAPSGFGEKLKEKIDHRKAEQQPAVEPEMKYEPEDIIVEDVSEEESPPPPPETKEEVRDIPALPVVEDIVDTKSESTSVSASVPNAVVDLIYWRDIKKTASVFSFLLLMLVSLICYSVISVVAYAGLALLTVTVAIRLYKLVLQTLNGTQQPHPFQEFLDIDIALSPERVQKYANAVSCHLNYCLTEARDLLLVKNTVSSLKFGVFLWLLTYVGALFNGLTLIIIDVVLIFTVPPVYEKYQTQIDHYYGMARDKVVDLIGKVKAKFPGSKQPKEKAQ